MRNNLYSYEPVMDPDYNQKNPWCLNSPKMPFFYKDTPKWYLAAKTRDFSQFARPISKYDLQCQSFTNTVTRHQNSVQV